MSAIVSTGGYHSCALENGKPYCWGWNTYGQLGDGSTASYSSVPVAVDTSGVLAGKTLTQITTGWNNVRAGHGRRRLLLGRKRLW